MFVRHFMSQPLVTIRAGESAGLALQRLREEGLRRLPVLDDAGRLVGIVTDQRLLRALSAPVRRGQTPAGAPLLVVSEIMHPDPFTTTPDALLEEAAALMAEKRIGSLVVMDAGRPVGIITETDMFRVFLRLLMGEERGLRVTVRAPAFRGILADITTEIARAGGNLLSLGNLTTDEGLLISFKVADLTRRDLEDILDELPVEDVDIREG